VQNGNKRTQFTDTDAATDDKLGLEEDDCRQPERGADDGGAESTGHSQIRN
jgi:hypothetical protein